MDGDKVVTTLWGTVGPQGKVKSTLVGLPVPVILLALGEYGEPSPLVSVNSHLCSLPVPTNDILYLQQL